MILTAALSLAGVKYAGITGRELRAFVLAGLVHAGALAAISIGFIEAIELMRLADPMDSFLSSLPGGQGEMVVIAIVAGADLSFVATHHLFRVIPVIPVISRAPIVARAWRRSE